MTQDQAIILAFKVVLLAVVVAVALWTAVYTYLAKWWKNPIGKTVVNFAVKVAIAMAPSLLSLFFQFNRLTSHLAAWIDVVVFAWIALDLFRRIPLWVRLHMDKGGRQVYTGMLPFLAEVARRRGRPIWKDWQQPAADDAGSPADEPEPTEEEAAP